MTTISGNYINGKWHLDDQLQVVDIINPANTTQVIGKVQRADKKVVQIALNAAKTASKSWKDIPLKQRIALARILLDRLLKNKQSIAGIITSENGKTLKEAESEVKAAVEESNFQIDYVEAHQTEISGNTQIRYEPLGVILAITPWNFPLATIMRKMIPALVCGNAVIVKPSEYTPLTAIALFELIAASGFPKGVLNLLNGNGEAIGKELVKSEIVKAISFTGSSTTGSTIMNDLVGRDVRFQAEMGGSNAVVVLNDANLDEMIQELINNGFACCGQWCTGTSRVIAEKEIHDKVLDRLIQHASRITYGNGKYEGIDMGPLANERQFKEMNRKIDNAISEGAVLAFGGKADSSEIEHGFFMKPTIFSEVTDTMAIAREEVFGPILTVIKARDIGHALSLVNNNQYGLSTSIYTQDEKKAERFISEVESGLVHINLPTAYREYSMPLMGWKNSGTGTPECGRFMLDLFTKPKVIYRK